MADETQSDFPEAWRPEPGDVITGTLAGVEMIDPSGNGEYPCVTLQTADGLRNVHAFHQVLRKSIARRRPKFGDELTILYHGKREGGKFGGYHSYKVSGGSDGEFNWDSELPEDERRDTVPIAPAPIPPTLTADQVQALRDAQAAEKSQETQAVAEKKFGEVPF